MSSAGVDTNVNIVINAEDNASSVVSSTTQTIEQRFKAHRTQLKAVRMEYELNHRGLLTTMRAMQSVGMVVNRAISIYNTWNLMQLRIQTANKNVADSQNDLNQILDQFGQDSPEFRRALEANKQALEDQKKAQDDARLGMALMVVSMIADSTRIITTVIPRLRSLAALIRTINRAPVMSTTPIGTPTPSTAPTPKSAGRFGGVGSKLSGIGSALKFSGPIAAVSTLSMMGEQTAGEEDLPSGLDQIPITVNFIVKNASEASEKTRQILENAYRTFSGGQ